LGKKELYDSQITQLGNKIEGYRQELDSLKAIIQNLEEDLASKLPLVKEKYLDKSSVWNCREGSPNKRGARGNSFRRSLNRGR
jgi:hypothetical protein